MTANSDFGPVQVKSVTVHDAHMIIVEIAGDGAKKHTEQCDDGRERQLIINKDSPYEKEMFSVALAAKASGKSITGWANGCHAFWDYKAPKLTVIALVD
ncbi:hypothetical protein [Photobacterium sp. 1_MG-2023]|uniref:hypothetical protein n=1 Tax=Photobacterium sp. 1_MG-2023 TaxID=3062646 RepID=UPI0026E210C2|nr:hypothetical protein [Photobacterium sp. 1_MG-2023]MDO6708191.1 hypothetical protein [Photobacterium sp. 1_MG-2023]